MTAVALGIAVIIFEALIDFLPGYVSDHTLWEHKIIYGTLFSVTTATSMLATLIITYQIHSLADNSALRKRYWYIVEITVQSVVIYSALMLAQAICTFVGPGKYNEHTGVSLAATFLDVLVVISSVSQIRH